MLQFEYIIIGSLEIIFSIIFAIITLIIGFKSLSFFTKDYNDAKEINNNNIAVGIVTTVFLICVGIALNTAAGPAYATFENTVFAKDITLIKILSSIGLVLLQLTIACITAIISLLLTIFLLTKISPFKNLNQLVNNNIAIALIIAGVMLITIFLIKDPLLTLLKGLIPMNKF